MCECLNNAIVSFEIAILLTNAIVFENKIFLNFTICIIYPCSSIDMHIISKMNCFIV